MSARLISIAVLAAGAMAFGAPASADGVKQAPAVWINPGLYAYHFARDKDLRDRNFGLGVEVQTSPRYGFLAGSYSNSNGARSHYAGMLWRPFEWRSASGLRITAGAALAAIDGYPNYRNGAWFVAALPMVSFEGKRLGLNVALIPTIRNRVDGALAFQVKLRVW